MSKSRSVLAPDATFTTVWAVVAALILPPMSRGDEWCLQSLTGPAPRFVHGMVYDTCRNVTLLYGGTVNNSGQAFEDTWEWDGQTWTLQATTGATARRQFGMGFDSNRCQTVLFGGNDAPGAYFNQTWEYDGTTSTWTQKFPVDSPSARSGPALAFDSTRDLVVLFGGYQPGLINDTWTWNGTNWTQVTTTTPPSPRSFTGMAYDSARDRLVVYGGDLNASCSGTDSDETWELDMSTSPATWTQISTTDKPSARSHARMVYRAGKIVLFGGTTGCATNAADTWEYNGQVPSWTLLAPARSPAGRWEHDMVYDSARLEAVLFGGNLSAYGSSPQPVGETWVYAQNPQNCIPTLTEWGVVVMGLLFLSAGAVVVSRRRAAG